MKLVFEPIKLFCVLAVQKGEVIMMADVKYASCNIAGEGKLYVQGSNRVEKFKIVDMSAAEINIETLAKVLEGTAVRLKIRLIGVIVDAHIDVNGKVVKRIENGYSIEFVGLSDSNREEIDELMRSSCNIDDSI